MLKLLKSTRFKRWLNVTTNRYNKDGYYQQAFTNGEFNANGFSIIGHQNKWKWTKNANRLARKPTYADMNGACLEDIDKDLARKTYLFDTECLDQKMKEEENKKTKPKAPFEFDCTLDQNDGWVTKTGCAQRKCAEWRVVDAWSLGKG